MATNQDNNILRSRSAALPGRLSSSRSGLGPRAVGVQASPADVTSVTVLQPCRQASSLAVCCFQLADHQQAVTAGWQPTHMVLSQGMPSRSGPDASEEP
jgi:hypothetical protein